MIDDIFCNLPLAAAVMVATMLLSGYAGLALLFDEPWWIVGVMP